MRQMHVNVLRGADDWWGFTCWESESDDREFQTAVRLLPADKGPWRWLDRLWWASKDHPDNKPAASDLEIIAGIEKERYYVCRADLDEMERRLIGE
jgi:hypothetical protein